MSKQQPMPGSEGAAKPTPKKPANASQTAIDELQRTALPNTSRPPQAARPPR